jgi:aquaporin Z
MTAILVASNHRILAPYTRYLAAFVIASVIAFESPLSGMSANPARTFGPALGMLVAAEAFLRARNGRGPFCAKLDHQNDKRCILCHSE